MHSDAVTADVKNSGLAVDEAQLCDLDVTSEKSTEVTVEKRSVFRQTDHDRLDR